MGEPPGSRGKAPSYSYSLPSFHDFAAPFARNDTLPVPGSSSRKSFDHHQHFMSEVNAASNSATNGGGRYHHDPPPPMTGDPSFDILDWYPTYQSCQRYFLDHAQHEPGTQALCALVNIRLPFQYLNNPIPSSAPLSDGRPPAGPQSNYQFNFPQPGNLPSPNRSRATSSQQSGPFISLVPYIRRLTITGFDKPAILHGFFGDDYIRGILPHLDCERRNYLFAAKAGGWPACKRQYDAGSGMGGEDETVPFMKPLEGARMEELTAAEKAWSQWLAMEDWMLGPQAPKEAEQGAGGGSRVGNVEAQRPGAGRREGPEHEGGLPDGVPEAFGGR